MTIFHTLFQKFKKTLIISKKDCIMITIFKKGALKRNVEGVSDTSAGMEAFSL